jgi:plastocyanin
MFVRLRVALAAGAILALLIPLNTSAATPKLNATVGPGFTITLTKGGKAVKSLKAGSYSFVVADKATSHNFHLIAPTAPKNKWLAAKGRATLAKSVGWQGTATLTIALKKGTYQFVCDPHKTSMKGSFKVT